MCISQTGNSKACLLIDAQQVQQESQFKYLGHWISDNVYAAKDIRSRTAMGKTYTADTWTSRKLLEAFQIWTWWTDAGC